MAILSLHLSPSAQLGWPSPSQTRSLGVASNRPLNFAAARIQKSTSALLKNQNLRRHFIVYGTGILWTGVRAGFAVAAAAMFGGKSNKELAYLAVKRGMELFVNGDVAGSLTKFDEALELDPLQKPYLWQRGLSLYYLNRFEEAALQFREDVAVNPNDTEESIWCFISEAQIQGTEEARKQFLEVGQDSRLVMRTAYDLFKNGGNPNDLVRDFKDGQQFEAFYAHLYAGLYHECEGNSEGARIAIVAATQTPYGARSGDYMAALAKVHCDCRKWDH